MLADAVEAAGGDADRFVPSCSGAAAPGRRRIWPAGWAGSTNWPSSAPATRAPSVPDTQRSCSCTRPRRAASTSADPSRTPSAAARTARPYAQPVDADALTAELDRLADSARLRRS
ncbi:hypothetical protein HBB16_05665 [Pseudonocardia sp. MCCB 268]|nr:hypothetical protein [Pseudonocardia cytotoxica]